MTDISLTLAPLVQQDRLGKRFLRTTSTEHPYVDVSLPFSYRTKDGEDWIATKEQPELPKGLIRLKKFNRDDDGLYYRLDQIELVEVDPSELSLCFIATIVYDGPDAPEVKALRRFRDDVLIPNPAGNALVKAYYSGAGKRLANLLETEAPSAIPVIRIGLDALVVFLRN